MHETMKKTNTKMEVKILSSTTISSNNKTVELPLNIFDHLTHNVHVAFIYAFNPPIPSNLELNRGLRETLVHIPYLTARVEHNSSHVPCSIVIGKETRGALLVEAKVDSDLSEHLPLMPSLDLSKLHPPRVQDGKTVDYALQVQLNRFRCGSLVIGATIHHMVADGRSMGFFFTAWGQAVRGVPIDPLPDFDQSWLKPRNPPNYELFKHLKPHDDQFFSNSILHDNEDGACICVTDEEKNDVANILLHFSVDFIKQKLNSKMKNDQYTTFEALTVYLWQKITLVRGLKEDMVTTLSISVNGRQRMKPPVSCNYFGNLVVDSRVPLKAKEVVQRSSLDDVVKIVRDAIKRIDDGYIKLMIDFGEVYKDEDIELPEDSNLLEVDSWRRIGFESLDFGCGSKVCALLPGWIPVDGVLIFLPSFGEEEGVQVVVSLHEQDAETLKRICMCEED